MRPDRAAVRGLSERTGGQSVLRARAGAARGRAAAIRCRRGVLDIVAARVGRLRDQTQRLLELAAVAGSEFDAELLRAGSGEPEEVVLDAIDEALRAGLLRELPGRPAVGVRPRARAGGAHRAALVRTAGPPPSLRRGACWPNAPSVRRSAGWRRSPTMRSPAPPMTPSLHSPTLSTPRGTRSSGWRGRTRSICSPAPRHSPRRRRRRPSGLPRCSSRSARRACAPARAIAGRAAFEEAARLARALPRDDMLARAALGTAGLGVTIVSVDEPLVALLEEALDRLGPQSGRVARPAALPACDRARLRARRGAPTRAGRGGGLDGTRARAIRARSRSRSPPRMSCTGRPSICAPASLPPMSSSRSASAAATWRSSCTDGTGAWPTCSSAATSPRPKRRSRATSAWPPRRGCRRFPGTCPPGGRRSQATGAIFPRRDGSRDEAHAQGTRARDANADLVLSANHYTLQIVAEAWERVRPLRPPCSGRLAGGPVVPRPPRALPGRARRRRSGARAAGRRRRPRASTACRGTRTY